MKKQNGGFTLIELVVVIVILGILAATAIPRFSNLSASAEQGVCDGSVGALMSSAVIQYGVAQGPTGRATVIANTDLSGASAAAGVTGIIDVTTTGGATCATPDLSVASGLGLTTD